jgi:hypothetical protein
VTLPAPLTITASAANSEVRFHQNGMANGSATLTISDPTLHIDRTIVVSGGGLTYIK